ncbi:hypothetical protein [Xanthobacter sp. ZOL 2024]
MTMHTLLRHLPHFGPSGVALPADGEARDIAAPPRREGPAAEAPRAPLPSFSGDDLRQAVARARHEARNEARSEAEAEARAALAASEAARSADAERLQAAFDQQLAEARAAWCQGEAERLAAAVADAFADLETRLGNALGKALTPFVTAAVRARALEEMKGHIAMLRAGHAAPLLTVSGPQDLVTALAHSLGDPAGVRFCATGAADLTVTCDDTIIETRLAAWVERLGGNARPQNQGGAGVGEG